MANTQNQRHERHERNERRASPLGAYLATAGALVLLVSVFLPWLTLGPNDAERTSVSGYEGDGVIPFMAYLALGFAAALLYATVRADRRQHRGLSLASFAAGIAALLWSISFLLDPISTSQYGENVSVEIGPWIALLGALLWAVGSFLLAKEPEGDFEDEHRTVARQVATHTETRPVSTHTETHHTGTTHTGTAHTTGTNVAGSHATTSGRVTDIDGTTSR